jgi:hypothetical protein
VIGRVVYFSTLGSQRTYGLDVRSGKVVFNFAHGSYNPAISDGHWLFITGHSGEIALEPRHQPVSFAAAGAASRAAHRAAKKRHAKHHKHKHSHKRRKHH